MPGANSSEFFLTDNTDKLPERPVTEVVLELLASPFSYETGLYFKGKKTYTFNKCGIVTFIGFIFIFSSFIVIFAPIFGGTTI